MRAALAVMSFAALLCPSPAQSEGPWAPDDLSNASRLFVRIHDQLPLSGDYRVAPDATVSIPVLGRISIAGKLLSEFERDLTARINEITHQDGYVAVEIAEYKPLFVSGLVTKPGAFPWLPGLTVGQAIALAGGIWRSPSGVSGRPGDSITAKHKLVDDLKRMMAASARLGAESSNHDQIEVPPDLVQVVGREEAEGLIAQQLRLLQSRRSSLSEQIAALERAKSNAETELAALKEQSERVAAQLAARQQASEGLERLKAKGLISLERSLEQKIRLLELEEKSTNIAVAQARVHGIIGSLERDTVTLKKSREWDIDAEKNKLDRDISAAKIELSGLVAATLTEASTPKRQDRRLRYFLTRGPGQPAEVSLDGSLRPGDVLLVTTQQGASAEQDASDPALSAMQAQGAE